MGGTGTRHAVLVGVLLLGACAKVGQPPVAERSPVFDAPPERYVVSRGDTLYSIAWRYGLDHRALARANGIGGPYTIFVGQELRLREAAPAPGRARAPQGQRTPERSPQAASPRPRSAASSTVAAWQQPTSGSVERGYGDGNRGIDFRLADDDRVVAAAAGEVVYAGSGLGGFRQLVILKHDPQYLSAYSFDRGLAVEEGQIVKAGALLADNVDGGRRAGTLHFEIRKDGDPVDPRPLIGTGR